MISDNKLKINLLLIQKKDQKIKKYLLQTK